MSEAVDGQEVGWPRWCDSCVTLLSCEGGGGTATLFKAEHGRRGKCIIEAWRRRGNEPFRVR